MHYGQLVFAKGANASQWKKKKNSPLNNWHWINRIVTDKRMKIDLYLKSLTKINSKWIKDLNGTPKTMKFLDENIGINLLKSSFFGLDS